MKIVYVTPYIGEKEIVTELLPEHEVVFLADPVTDSIPEEVRDADVLSVFVNSTVTAEMIDSMPNLRMVALRSTGFDHVAVAHAKEKGIIVSSVPHYGSQTVAEYAFSLMLALSRKTYAAYELLRIKGEVDVKRFEGFDLCGKTLGVIGTGAIGRRSCEMAQGFRMRVIAHDMYPNEEWAAESGVEYVDFDRLLAEADIITLHIPSSPENHHLLDADAFAKCKRGIYIVNTARGDLIDTVALTHALKDGQVSGAGLDVFEGEQYIKDEMQLLDEEAKPNEDAWRAFAAEHELLQMENVIVTPHLAFNSVEAKREITETTTANIAQALAGEPQNEVSV